MCYSYNLRSLANKDLTKCLNYSPGKTLKFLKTIFHAFRQFGKVIVVYIYIYIKMIPKKKLLVDVYYSK